jgi:hypothetical protein
MVKYQTRPGATTFRTTTYSITTLIIKKRHPLLSVVLTLSVALKPNVLSVAMPSVVILNVVAPAAFMLQKESFYNTCHRSNLNSSGFKDSD